MQPKKTSKQEKIFYGCLFGLGVLVILFFLTHFFICFNSETMDINTGLVLTIEHMQAQPFDIFPLPIKNLGISLFIMTLMFILWQTEESKRKRMMPGKEEGSAKWNEDLKKYNKKYSSPKGKESNTGADNMIFTNDVFMSMNTRQTMRNNNVLVIGGSGAGKSRFLVKPNLLQANCSYVITDPSGELLETCAGFLEKEGYKVKIFNLVEMQYSHHYNPFNYIRNDEGVLMMINCLIQNTTPQGASKGDPFWEKSETALLLAICFYLHYEVRPEDRNFSNVMRLLLKAEVKEDQEDFKSPLDILFEELEKVNPTHIAVRYYKIFKMGAGKTLKSILISCTVRLGTFNLKAVQDLTNVDTIDLKSLGDEKQALFVVIPSADTTFNYLVSMMYSQLFETLYFHAENEIPSKRLPSHVRFMLDEFANIGTIPDFEKKLATMRKYEISCTIILQNLAQLKTMYKDAWESITGNCDSFLFLGGQEQTTLEYVSKKLGKKTILTRGTSNSKGGHGSHSENYNNKGRDLMSPDEISRMDNKNCILFIRGLFPFFGEKYDYPKHKNYKYTGDAKDEQLYHYRDSEKFLIPETKKVRTVNRNNIAKNRVKHTNSPHRTREIRKTTQSGTETFKINDVTADTIKQVGITPEIEKPTDAITIIETFRADHEFYAADEFKSSFLEEPVEDKSDVKELNIEKSDTEEPKEDKATINPEYEIIDEPENPFNEFDIPDDFDEPLEPEFDDISETDY